MPPPPASLKTSLSPPTCRGCLFLATSQWKPAKNRLVTSNRGKPTALEAGIISKKPPSSFTAPQVFHSPFVCGRVCRAIIHRRGLNLVCRLHKTLYETLPPLPLLPCQRKHEWNCSGLSGPSLSLQTERRCAWKHTHKHAHLDHAAVDKSALKGRPVASWRT